ncbi:MAG: proprotein convertase P-domain-containing protein, partial [Bacteroidota bacterium]|nr:proprotein convertase P-domain-containing protein [Bacteroidota bacterium]
MKKQLLLLLAVLPFIATAQTFTHTTGGPIPDTNTEVCFPVTVSGLPTVIDTTFGLISACINVSHTYDGDLKIRLKSPDGTVILLANNNGGGGDNFTNSCFAANGSDGSINAGFPPFTGSFSPFQSTNLLNNSQNPNGVWNLCIIDEVPIDAGTLISYSISFGPNPPVDTTFTGGGGTGSG